MPGIVTGQGKPVSQIHRTIKADTQERCSLVSWFYRLVLGHVIIREFSKAFQLNNW
jgi:hypothetical protein